VKSYDLVRLEHLVATSINRLLSTSQLGLVFPPVSRSLITDWAKAW
jgi:hypothetical protein